jgi:hypothetical protein
VSLLYSGHVSTERLGEAARHATLEWLRDHERRHVAGCERCRRLYAGYRLADRLLMAPWAETALPATALAQRPIATGWRALLERPARGLGARALVVVALTACLALIVGFGVLLPQLAPVGSQPSGSTAALASASKLGATATPAPGGSSGPSYATPSGPAPAVQSPVASAGSGEPGATPAPTPARAATSIPPQTGALAGLPGLPISWSPDGSHLLVGKGGTGQLQIRTSAGGLSATFAGDSAAWLNSTTLAVAAHSRTGIGSENVTLLDLGGATVATLVPGEGDPTGNDVVLLGSGNGEVALIGPRGLSKTQTYVLWDGHNVSAPHQGVPIAFSSDGSRLAVIHPSGSGVGTGVGHLLGSLEILSVPSLQTVSTLSRLSLRIATGNPGPGYAPDASFSPDGARLLVSGTLVDLSRGSTIVVGEGGWLPDGTLVTSTTGGIVRWQGTSPTPDASFAPGGRISTSRRGDVIEVFGDGRSPLLLTASGRLGPLNLPGVASLDDVLLAPDGSAVAIDGRGTNGSGVTAVALLR